MKTVSFSLTNENINRMILLIKDTGVRYRAERRMLTESCLALEEVMLNFQAHFGTGQEIQLKMKKRFGDFICMISLPGKSYNPLRQDVSGQDSFILDVIDLAPRYSYSLGVNQITVGCKINQGKKELRTIFLSVFFGILLGVLGRFLPDTVMEPALALVNALSDKIFGLIKMIAPPVVFLCVLYGVLGSGTIRNFRLNGIRMLRKYLLSMFCMLLFVTAVSMLAFNIRIVTARNEVSAVNTLIDTVFSLIPDNMFSPFVEGDNIKVILLGILFGCALLSLGDKAGAVNRGCRQLKDVCSVVMSWISKLIPLLIVVVLVSNIWNGNLGPEMLSAWKIVAVFFFSILCILFITMFMTVRICKIKLKDLLAAILLPGMKGLISSSTMFCYSDMDEGLKKKLHVSDTTVDFGIPMGIAFYHSTTLLYAVFVLYFASTSGVTINPAWVISFLLICFVTGIAVPPVSGGAVSLLAVLFVSFGISDAGTAMAFPLIMLMDYPNTAFRVMTLMMEIAVEQAQHSKKTAGE